MGLWAALGAIAIATQPPWVQRAEGQAQALLLALRGPVPAPDNVVILGIDEESLTQGDLYRAAAGPEFPQAALQTWPLPRATYATVIENLTAAGAQVVAIDVLMVDPQRLRSRRRCPPAAGAGSAGRSRGVGRRL
jgi:adenylate cyclase